MTETPPLDPPTRTAPKIVGADPPPSELITLSIAAGNYSQTFNFEVVGEDTGQAIKQFIVVDYGQDPSTILGQQGLQGPDIPAGKLSDGPRAGSNTVHLPVQIYDNGFSHTGQTLHSLTLIVSHDFGGGGQYFCPRDPSDADEKTWFVQFCPSDDKNCSIKGFPGTSHHFCDNAGAGGGGP